jgi:hypothetical protein
MASTSHPIFARLYPRLIEMTGARAAIVTPEMCRRLLPARNRLPRLLDGLRAGTPGHTGGRPGPVINHCRSRLRVGQARAVQSPEPVRARRRDGEKICARDKQRCARVRIPGKLRWSSRGSIAPRRALTA